MKRNKLLKQPTSNIKTLRSSVDKQIVNLHFDELEKKFKTVCKN